MNAGVRMGHWPSTGTATLEFAESGEPFKTTKKHTALHLLGSFGKCSPPAGEITNTDQDPRIGETT